MNWQLEIAKRCVADASHGSEPSLRYWNGEWYRWNGCIYVKLFADEVKRRIFLDLVRTEAKPPGRTVINAVLDMMRHLTLIEGSTVPCWLSQEPAYPADEIVAAQNGLLHLPSLVSGRSVVLPHSPSFFALNALPYRYEKDATCPQWERFLAELWGDDAESIDTLQEWCGYLLLPDTRQQKLLMLIGPTRSGKGTLARVFRMLLGESNVASPTIRSLSGSFGLWGLLGKSLAIVPDASPTASSSLVELLKSLTGEDALDIDRKNLAPLSSVKLTARLMIIANDLPEMSDPSGALAERLLIVRTTHSWAGREDKTLTAKLLTELPGILRWAVQGWRRLRKRGHFRQPRSSRHLIDRYRTVSASDRTQDVRPIAAKKTARPVVDSRPFGKIGVSWKSNGVQVTILQPEREAIR